MALITCPGCGHALDATLDDALDHTGEEAPDPTVVRWFRSDASWTGEASTEEVYATYLRSTDAPPVSRGRFVADLAYLGVEQVLDDETAVLLRP